MYMREVLILRNNREESYIYTSEIFGMIVICCYDISAFSSIVESMGYTLETQLYGKFFCLVPMCYIITLICLCQLINLILNQISFQDFSANAE